MGRNDLEYRIMRAELNESYMQTELIVLYLLEPVFMGLAQKIVLGENS